MARKMKTMDGNSAVAHVSYAFTDVAAIYPITPSSVMADLTDKFSAQGAKNLFGRQVQVTEMQSVQGFRIQWGKNSWKVSFLCSNSGISRKLHRRCCWIADFSEDNL